MALVLTRGDLRPLIEDLTELEGAFQRVEEAVLQQEQGEAGYATYLPARLQEHQHLAIYTTVRPSEATVRIWPDVGSTEHPPESHVMLLLDGSHGQLRAILAGDDLNVLRTSVPVGVGVKHLAPEATVYGLLGTGEQAGGHIRAVAHAVSTLERVRVYSRTPANREQFAATWSEKLGIEVEAVDSAEAAVREADVVSNAATGGNLLVAEWVKPGALITSVGGPPIPGLDVRIVIPARQRPSPIWPRFHQPGQEAPIVRHDATLAQVIRGEAPIREQEDQIVLYTVAAPWSWDGPIMQWAYDWAVAHDAGTTIDFSASERTELATS